MPAPLLALPPLAALLLVLVACGGGGGTTPVTPTPEVFGLEDRAPLVGLGFPAGVPQPRPLGLEEVFAALSFERPVLLSTAPDAAHHLYVVEQGGLIHVIEDDPATTTQTAFLDIRDRVLREGNEEGLLGLAFDPDFGTTNGTFWVHYSAADPRRSVIARFEATFPASGPPVADAATQVVVMEIPQPYRNHNGGAIVFGPDDMLYVGLGDGGGFNDPDLNGQDTTTLNGTILRIDVRGQATYAVPADNPFVGEASVRDEIWAYGIRNPWKIAFDRETGELWVGDVGQGDREEIAVVGRGENHGWPIYEGERSNKNPQGLPASLFSAPVFTYDHGEGTCIIGGFVVRGNAVPSLSGAYIYGDYTTGRVWALVRDGSGVHSNTEVQSVSQVVSFGEDDDGRVYALSLGGTIWRFQEPTDPPPTTLPDRLSETGLFVDTARLTPNPGLIAYDVNSPLWSDGTSKRRWIGVPGLTRIDFDARGAWDFPVETVLVKHFEIETEVGNPASRRRLETRVLLHAEEGWRAFTYRWNEAETDADLLVDGATEMIPILDASAPGGERVQRYDYPSRTDCLRCHNDADRVVLGVNARQLNRAFDYPRARDNQLRSWNHIGLFDRDVGDPAMLPALADPHDVSVAVEPRARAYLDANCAFCHRPDGPTPSGMDLRWDVAESMMGLPEVPERDALWERLGRLDATRMPPLSSHVVDEAGVELVRGWVETR